MYDDFDCYKLVIPEQDYWDEYRERFVTVKSETLILKHTLVSLNKFESINGIARFGRQQLTRAQRIEYIKCMVLNEVKDENVFLGVTDELMLEVDKYIDKKMTATTFREVKEKKINGRFVTAELIYYWMSAFNIPYQPCENWHLNKLLTVIKVCSEEQKGPQKMNRKDAMEEQHRLNQERRKKYNTKG